jgi:hypothetical protein
MQGDEQQDQKLYPLKIHEEGAVCNITNNALTVNVHVLLTVLLIPTVLADTNPTVLLIKGGR